MQMTQHNVSLHFIVACQLDTISYYRSCRLYRVAIISWSRYYFAVEIFAEAPQAKRTSRTSRT